MTKEQEEAIQLKRDIIAEQNGRCKVCCKPFSNNNLPQIAHRLPKTKYNLKFYGKAIIHHRYNLVATCANCNSSVLLRRATHPIETEELIAEIKVSIMANK